jgi:CspA family cold shock protein
MASGTVKWFNGQKGIQPDAGGKNVFVHVSAVERAGLSGLPDGAKVTLDVVPNRGKESAEPADIAHVLHGLRQDNETRDDCP